METNMQGNISWLHLHFLQFSELQHPKDLLIFLLFLDKTPKSVSNSLEFLLYQHALNTLIEWGVKHINPVLNFAYSSKYVRKMYDEGRELSDRILFLNAKYLPF